MTNFAKVQKFDILVEGVSVSVVLEEHGNPLTAAAGAWLGGDEERLTRLAIAVAQGRAQRAAIRKAEAAKHKKRTDQSARVRREAAKTHWSREWLQAAHLKYPDYGAKRLAPAARRIVAMNGKDSPAYAKRDEITKYRAEQFLQKLRRK